jgi:hypothetical protein
MKRGEGRDRLVLEQGTEGKGICGFHLQPWVEQTNLLETFCAGPEERSMASK